METLSRSWKNAQGASSGRGPMEIFTCPALPVCSPTSHSLQKVISATWNSSDERGWDFVHHRERNESFFHMQRESKMQNFIPKLHQPNCIWLLNEHLWNPRRVWGWKGFENSSSSMGWEIPLSQGAPSWSWESWEIQEIHPTLPGKKSHPKFPKNPIYPSPLSLWSIPSCPATKCSHKFL